MYEKSNIVTIYVYLLDEGIDVWRPVDGIHIKNNIYQIKPESIIPKTETWQFLPSDIVLCEEKILSKGKQIVAVKKIEFPAQEN